MKYYKNHPYCKHKKSVFLDSLNFDLPPTSEEDINKIVKSLNVNNATGPDPHRITLKLIKLSANVADKYLTSILNHDI